MPPSTVVPFRIALAQNNLHKAEEYLLDVSHPESPNFGKHWNAKQVADAFAPSQESRKAVIGWLQSSGISSDRISKSQSVGWLTFNATIAEGEKLLKTSYHLHKHVTGKPHVGCDAYYVPQHIQPHVDFITPTVHFDTRIPKKKEKRTSPTIDAQTAAVVGTAAAGVPVHSKAALKITNPNDGT